MENVEPAITVKSVSGKPIGPCAKSEIPKPAIVKPTPHMTKNYPPVPRNQVDRVNASVGHLLVYKVPAVSIATIQSFILKISQTKKIFYVKFHRILSTIPKIIQILNCHC